MGKCVKLTIIIVNCFIAAIGLGIGGYACYKQTQKEDMIGPIVVGFLLALICFIAILGAALENRVILIIYIVVISCMMVASIAVGAVYCVFASTEKDTVEKVMKQETTDWYQREWVSRHMPVFAKGLEENGESCCKCEVDKTKDKNGTLWQQTKDCDELIKKNDTKKDNDCCEMFKERYQSASWVLAGLLFGVAAIEAAAIGFACCMCNDIKKKKGDYAPQMYAPPTRSSR